MSAASDASRILSHVSLAGRTTLGVGGQARWLATTTCEDDLLDALAWSRRNEAPVFVLGGGTNVVVSDAGFDGLVIDVAIRGIRCTERERDVHLRVGAGESWDDVVSYAVTRGLSGVECLAGIPGRVGATPIQNVGAYGQEVAETIDSVDAIALSTGERRVFSKRECEFGYRDSIFKRAERGRWVVTAVTFALVRHGSPSIRYPELARALEGNVSPTLLDVREAVIKLRTSKGMVIDANDPDTRSVGSFFMNPVVDDESFDAFLRRAKASGIDLESIPRFPAAGETKLSAAWLIEHAGFRKGMRFGRAGLSSKHALAVVNAGDAEAEEIRALAERIQSGVEESFGIRLEPEPTFVGW